MADLDLAIIGAGAAGCALAAALRRRGWGGSMAILEVGRGIGGRTATRRSRRDAGLRINHGAPLFNIATDPAPELLQPLASGGWIQPFEGPILSLDGDGRLAAGIDDGFSRGQLWQGSGGMDRLCEGLLTLAGHGPGATHLHTGTLVRHLQPPLPGDADAWSLRGGDGSLLLRSRWLVLSGTLLAHPRCRAVFGWDAVPLQQAAALHGDPQLQAAAAGLAAISASASSHLLLTFDPARAGAWQRQPWRLLQFSPEAQRRWGLRRVSLQALEDQRMALVAESSTDFAERHRDIYGSRSAAAQLLRAAPPPEAEAAVIDALDQALRQALGRPTDGADRQLMRWGAAFPQPPGLAEALSLCPDSRIGFCGDAIAGAGFGRVEGALRSAESLAAGMVALL
jgi:predicted NAD/FAD-dependent oxidoreductase